MRRRLAWSVAAALLAVAVPLSASAEVAEPTLPAIKSAFVFNFIKLVSWPDRRFDSESSPVRVCVVRGDEMLDAMRDSISGKLVGTRPIEVTAVAPDDSFAACHVLYLGVNVANRYGPLMARAAGKGILVVDEGLQFTWPDGMIRLFQEQNRMRFELNLESVERSGLKVDPRLIRLARIATR